MKTFTLRTENRMTTIFFRLFEKDVPKAFLVYILSPTIEGFGNIQLVEMQLLKKIVIGCHISKNEK